MIRPHPKESPIEPRYERVQTLLDEAKAAGDDVFLMVYQEKQEGKPLVSSWVGDYVAWGRVVVQHLPDMVDRMLVAVKK